MGFKNILWQGSGIKQDSSNRLVTDNEKTTWNNKANNSHTHTKSDIKDFPSSLPASDVYSWAKASTKPSYSWSEIGSKPSTFTPSSHNHAISEITNLQSVLNGKASYNHNHDSSYIKSVGSSILVSGTYKYINTFPNVYSVIDQESGNTPTNNRAVIWYNYEYQDSSNLYEDYCDHYLNIGSPNSGNGDENFGVIAAIRFMAAYSSGWIALRGRDNTSKQYSVYLPLNAGTLQVSSSDSKLKTNIKDTEVNDAISFINKIHLHSFDWKTDDTHQPIGFVADELEELDERLSVGGNSDKVDKNGLPIDPKCVNTFYLQGYEVKAIQELSNKVDTLEKENNKKRVGFPTLFF